MVAWEPERCLSDARLALGTLSDQGEAWWVTWAQRALAIASVETGDITAGIIGLVRLLDTDAPSPERARTLVALGEAYLRRGDLSAAVEVLLEAEELNRTQGIEYWRAKGLFLLAQADSRSATRWRNLARRLSDGDRAYDQLLLGRSRLVIRLFGQAEITVDGRRCHFATHNAELAVYLLSLAPAGTLHAEVLADRLWSDLPPDRQAGRIRTLLWHVRGGLGPAHAWRVSCERKVVHLDLAGASVDALAWRNAAHALLRGDLPLSPSGERPPSALEVAGALRQPLLPAWQYEEWVSEHQDRLRQLSAQLAAGT